MQPFRFKQFEVRHDHCAMKVNTDGVLLGAWADVDGAKRALDVGTGSGVIALMLAQRGVHHIEALEIDQEAAEQALENFTQSGWSAALQVHPMALQQFLPEAAYDLIVSNPPYFDNAYKTPLANRNLARHNDTLPLNDLMAFTAEWLTQKGKLDIILPVEMENSAKQHASSHGLYLNRCCRVKGVAGGDTKRLLLEFGREEQKLFLSDITIEISPLVYTSEYKELLKDFYLAF
ncbi:methyltransferase [soil metagenome]